MDRVAFWATVYEVANIWTWLTTEHAPIFQLEHLLIILCFLSVVKLFSRVQLFATPWTEACQASLSLTISWSLAKFLPIALAMPPNRLILWCPLLLLLSVFPSIRDFSNESSVHIRWPKYWSFSFNISPSNEYSGLISLKIDQIDLLAVQGTITSFFIISGLLFLGHFLLLCFPPKEVPLEFVRKPVWWFQMLLAFACL